MAQKAEVLVWRAALRESEFLENPMVDCVMESVGGNPLDDQLPHFTDLAWSRRKYFYSVYFQGATAGTYIPDPIFVLPQERFAYHDIKNQTKEQIALKINELIDQLPDDVKFDFAEEWIAVQRRKKDDYLLFYERVSEEVERCNAAPSLNESDDIDFDS